MVPLLDEQDESARSERVAARFQILDRTSEVVLVRRTVLQRRRPLVDEYLQPAHVEEGASGPLGRGRGIGEVAIEPADRYDVLREQGGLCAVRHVAISNSRRTSFRDVFRSVDSLRVPTMSAQGRS